MMFSVPRSENDDRRYRELAVSGHDGIRLVSVEHDPLDRVTTYVFAFDDGPPGDRARLPGRRKRCAIREPGLHIAGDSRRAPGMDLVKQRPGAPRGPARGDSAERGASRYEAACPARAPGLTARET